jgi:hypothetical protein
LATHIVGPLYGVPHGILHVFNTILYENEFLNPQMSVQQTISCFPEHSTLVRRNYFSTFPTQIEDRDEQQDKQD